MAESLKATQAKHAQVQQFLQEASQRLEELMHLQALGVDCLKWASRQEHELQEQLDEIQKQLGGTEVEEKAEQALKETRSLNMRIARSMKAVHKRVEHDEFLHAAKTYCDSLEVATANVKAILLDEKFGRDAGQIKESVAELKECIAPLIGTPEVAHASTPLSDPRHTRSNGNDSKQHPGVIELESDVDAGARISDSSDDLEIAEPEAKTPQVEQNSQAEEPHPVFNNCEFDSDEENSTPRKDKKIRTRLSNIIVGRRPSQSQSPRRLDWLGDSQSSNEGQEAPAPTRPTAHQADGDVCDSAIARDADVNDGASDVEKRKSLTRRTKSIPINAKSTSSDQSRKPSRRDSTSRATEPSQKRIRQGSDPLQHLQSDENASSSGEGEMVDLT